MDGPIFPLTFYCRNAQLCLTKATESQKSGFGAEELQHLRTFTTLVSETIPAHPNYRNRQEDKQVLELHAYLPEAGKRIRELEATGVESSRTRRKLTSHGRHGSRHSKPPVDVAVASRARAKTATGGSRPSDSSSPESMKKPEKSVRIAGISRSPNHTLAEKDQKWDINLSLNMQETYGTVLTKCMGLPRSISLIQRQKDAKPPVHHLQDGKLVTRSQVLPHSSAGELMPCPPKSRDTVRVRGGRGTIAVSSSGRKRYAVRHVSSKGKDAEMPSYECGHESLSCEKSSFTHERSENVGKDIGCRVECTESNQDVVLVKSCTHVFSKHKLAKHATSGRVRTRPGEFRDAPLEHGSSGSVGIVGTTQDEDEMGDENSRGFRTGHGDESNASDGMKQRHHRRKNLHEDQESHGSRGDVLREWKGDFVSKSERIQGGFDEVETIGGSPVRSVIQSRRRHSVEGRVGNRPASAPRRMQGVVMEHKSKEAGENLDEINERGSRVFLAASGKHDKPFGMAPELQRGMKEDCEHFRREMRLLKEKANTSRIREVEVEGLAEKLLQRRLVDEMDLAGGDPNRLKHYRNRALRDSRGKDKVCAMHGTIIDSPRLNRLRGGHPHVNQGPDPLEAQETFEPGRVHSSEKISPSVTASGSTSGSSLTSLPLSHYIQKLKDFSPDSQLGSANLKLFTPVNKSAGNDFNQPDHQEKDTVLPTSNECGNGLSFLSAETTLSSGGSAPAILLPASTNSSHGLPRPHSRLVNNRFGLVRTSGLYTSLAHPTNFRASQLDSGSVALFNSNPDFHHQDEERTPATVTTLNDQLLYPHFQTAIEHNTLLEGNDLKRNNIQHFLGELKGSVEGMKIRLEVDGQGWRGRVDGLEKELENLKEEADDEIVAAKHSLRNEMRVKLGDLMAEIEKMRRQERVEIELMVGERIEKAQKDTRSAADMKDEIRHLWAEVEALVKSREEMQGHVEHLTSVAQNAQEHANREHDMLKSENGYLRKQLQSLKNDVQVRLETDDFRAEREDLRLAVDRLRGEGNDMNLEIQSLKKVEKIIKLELENIRSGLAKLQEETQVLERQKGTSQIEGGRERLLIMERVESLSQLYLGGLEDVRADVFNVKFNCRDRIQDFENQWKEFRKQLPEESTFASKQMLLDELDHFRGEIAETVEIESGLLRQTLERESEAVQQKLKELLLGSKGEIVNVIKLDVQKWLQATQEKAFLMTEALKQDLDILKNEIGRTQEGAEDLLKIVSAAEIQRNLAAAAAAEASMSATKARNVLLDVTTNINSEMSTVHHRIKQFQENLTVENDVVVSATYEARKVSQELLREKEAALFVVQEARQKHQELQEYMETESSRLSTALMEVQRDGVRVQKERDTASQAASETTSSAMKAGEVLAEILGMYKLEVAKARDMSLQLQEGLEKERAVLERERELASHYSHNAQERFNEEFELAIDGWKRSMNAEIGKAKEATDELEKQLRRHTPFDADHPNLQLATTDFAGQPDLKNYISKTEKSISGLTAMVKELQDYREHLCEEKKRHMILKQQENERKEQHWNGEISQINQVVRVVEKRMLDACGDYTEMRKRLKKCEGAQVELVHTVEEVSSTTSDVAKTVSNWLPKYEAAARIVNDLACKVERVEEKFEGFSCDEGLVQRISRIAETKVEGLKELVLSSADMKDIGQELRDLHERVESSDRDLSQAVGEVATRVAVLERTRGPAGQPSPGLSLKVEYTDGAAARKQGMGLLSQSVEALERKMEFTTEHTGALVGGHESATDSRLLGLESRIEHVASATFTNLRLLDSKVDRVSLGMQSAVEGAALAESKCGALGAELVKVFRMLTACKNPNNNGNPTNRQQTNMNNNRWGRSHSPRPHCLNPQLDSRSQSPHNRATTFPRGNINRAVFSPKRRSRIYISPNRPKGGAGPVKRASHRSMARNGEADSLKLSTGSDSGKLTARDQAEGESTYSGASEEASSPTRTSSYTLRTSLHDPVIGLHTQGAQLTVHERPQLVERPQLKPHSPLQRRPDSSGISSRSNSAIRLEAGRIHADVTYRSAVVSQSEKRENRIAVQS